MNFVGLLLVALAIALFIVEVFSSAYALFAMAGLVSLILGLILLFDFAVPPWVTVTLFILIVLFSIAAAALIWQRVASASKQKVATGAEELIGQTAEVRNALQPEGRVFIAGEIWQAELPKGQHAEPGEEVTVTGISGLKLFVAKKS